MIKYFSGITFTFLLLLKIVSGQTVSTEIVPFEIYADSVLRSSESRWTDYPKCPPLTKDILTGLKREFSSDSVKFYFEKLESMNVNHQIDYQSSMNYFERNNYTFALLAMSNHSNPDIRTFTMMSMNQRLKLRKSDNLSSTMSQDDIIALRFLIYLFEYYPKFISGSENSTIHGNYISNIAWNIDLLTNEKLTSGKYVYTWYKNETNYLSVMKKWKEHLPKQ